MQSARNWHGFAWLFTYYIYVTSVYTLLYTTVSCTQAGVWYHIILEDHVLDQKLQELNDMSSVQWVILYNIETCLISGRYGSLMVYAVYCNCCLFNETMTSFLGSGQL